jgi:hypothetical protein
MVAAVEIEDGFLSSFIVQEGTLEYSIFWNPD